MKKGKNAPDARAGIWLVRAVSLLIVVIVLLIAGRAWLAGTLSCVQAFEAMEYTDEDERARMLPWDTPAPTKDIFTDGDYDRVYPDLVEPTRAP